MSGKKRREPEDDEIIFLETDSRDAVAKALQEAERAIEAVEERQRQRLDETVPAAPPAPPVSARAGPEARHAGGRRERGARAGPEGARGARGHEGARDPGRGRGRPAARSAPAQVGGLRQPQAPHREGQGGLLQVRPRGRVPRPSRRCSTTSSGRWRTAATRPSEDFQAGIDMIARQLGRFPAQVRTRRGPGPRTRVRPERPRGRRQGRDGRRRAGHGPRSVPEGLHAERPPPQARARQGRRRAGQGERDSEGGRSWLRFSGSTSGRRTPASPWWRWARPRSSPTARAPARRRRSSGSPRTASASSDRSRNARRSRIPRRRSTPSSASSAANGRTPRSATPESTSPTHSSRRRTAT